MKVIYNSDIILNALNTFTKLNFVFNKKERVFKTKKYLVFETNTMTFDIVAFDHNLITGNTVEIDLAYDETLIDVINHINIRQ